MFLLLLIASTQPGPVYKLEDPVPGYILLPESRQGVWELNWGVLRKYPNIMNPQ